MAEAVAVRAAAGKVAAARAVVAAELAEVVALRRAEVVVARAVRREADLPVGEAVAHPVVGEWVLPAE